MRLPFCSLRIRGFRSISDEGLILENLSSLNFLCGQNNSGKSNILQFIQLLCNSFATKRESSFLGTDFHQGGSGRISFALLPNFRFIQESSLLSKQQKDFYAALEQIQQPWISYAVNNSGNATLDGNTVVAELATRFPPHKWQSFFNSITGHSGGSIVDWIPKIMENLHPLRFLGMPADIIPAFRTLSEVRHQGLSVQDHRVMMHNRPYYGGMGTSIYFLETSTLRSARRDY